jgi:hypothetical protein
MPLIRAALILPTDSARWLAACWKLADRRGWEVTKVVHDWDSWVTLACGGKADIGIVPRWEHLPPGRTPRIVALEDPPTPPTGRSDCAARRARRTR